MQSPVFGSVRLRLEVPAEARAGTTVPILLRIENPGDAATDLYLRGRTIAFDVVVRRASGEVAWRRLEGHVIPAVLRLEVLAAHEALELRTEWNQRTNAGAQVGPGSYVLRGLLLTDAPSPLETEPVTLRVLAD